MTRIADLPAGRWLRCDRCRRLWPVADERGGQGWYEDAAFDAHLCRSCAEACDPQSLRTMAQADPSGWKRQLALVDEFTGSTPRCLT